MGYSTTKVYLISGTLNYSMDILIFFNEFFRIMNNNVTCIYLSFSIQPNKKGQFGLNFKVFVIRNVKHTLLWLSLCVYYINVRFLDILGRCRAKTEANYHTNSSKLSGKVWKFRHAAFTVFYTHRTDNLACHTAILERGCMTDSIFWQHPMFW
jgi:hypothetical protein